MRKKNRRSPSAPLAYQLPEEEYAALIQARNQLVMMACLCEPRSRDERNALSLSPEALAHCFQRFADELNAILDAVWWPTDRPATR